MNLSNATIGLEVVRTNGDQLIGEIGTIVSINGEKARVNWGFNHTSIGIKNLQPTSIPYEIQVLPHPNRANAKAGMTIYKYKTK